MTLINFNGILNYFENNQKVNFNNIKSNIESINSSSVVGSSSFTSFSSSSNNENILIKKDIIDILLSSKYSIELKDLVKHFEKSIVALTFGPGSPFATGLLIHPKYVLTTSYSIKKQFLNMVSVRIDYQKTFIKIQGNNSVTPTIDLGENIKVKRIYERNNEIGYCILELEHSVPESYEFNSKLKLFLKSDTNESNKLKSNEHFLFSHPSSGPKKVTFDFDQKTHSNSLKGEEGYGSSGGVLIDSSSRVLSILNVIENNDDENEINLINISSIYEKSQLLKLIFPNGEYTPINVIPPSIDDGGDSEDDYNIENFEKRIMVTRGNFPGPKANDNNKTGIQFSYHHIVPAGYQDFLFFLSIEVNKINQLLADIYKQDIGRINYIVWSKWNLFQGPSNRFHKNDLIEYLNDPNAKGWDPSDSIEEYKPLSFNQQLWNFNQDIFTLLNQCWDERNKITKKSKKEIIQFIDLNYRKNNLKDLINDQIDGLSTEKYELSITNIFNKFESFKFDLMKFQEIGVHQYNENDWVSVNIGGKNNFKYYLK
ncbi:hypothetical protein DDB_G0290057 [Dictyostelium discoideum AX4]|uniref:Serine protease n=1 Tax=Dictyostelium discoideum TaxID=44689 RepID=Q54GN4_DICDI|nr:hypothetical protein DDB_G0290057 [Dictyostelium discoideum AX4]EAL62434.1 hypothetical protein DDB_G0290057 [Dictyostelium discoideum AX4]|eukprot:XP_635928.1 hypothetical protein DDB_G0290057 [Dictyostelium discoideum AX4]